MGDSVFERQLKLAKDVPALWLGSGLAFDVGDKARPWSFLEFVQQGRIMLWHFSFPP
jgi:hypothetical protein